MKFSQRLLLLLLVFVLSFGLFSVPVGAETVNKQYRIDINIYDIEDLSNPVYLDGVYGLTGENFNVQTTFTRTITENTGFLYFYGIRGTNEEILFKKGENVKITVDNIISYMNLNGGDATHSKGLDTLDYYFGYSDGSLSDPVTISKPHSTDTMNFNKENNTHNVNLEFTAEKDIKVVYIREINKVASRQGTWIVGKSYTIKNTFGFKPASVTVDIQSEEAGLLSGLIEWVKNIANSITELPQKIWNLISDGLKSLFVPDEQFMADYSDKWDELLSDRLGAIYQVGDLVLDSWEQIENADETNTIEFPKVDLSSVGIPFEFGGYTVTILSSKFETVVDILKVIVGILCCIAFINGLLKKYDEVMGVEQ